MKLTLIRHGMTRGNMLHIYYGSTDLPILPESYTELEARAKTGFYPTAERYYTSGMLRAEQSFRAIYGDTPHSVLYGMREADFGDFEMRNYAELKDDPAYIEWISGNNEDNICPNGESGEQVTVFDTVSKRKNRTRSSAANCTRQGNGCSCQASPRHIVLSA